MGTPGTVLHESEVVASREGRMGSRHLKGEASSPGNFTSMTRSARRERAGAMLLLVGSAVIVEVSVIAGRFPWAEGGSLMPRRARMTGRG